MYYVKTQVDGQARYFAGYENARNDGVRMTPRWVDMIRLAKGYEMLTYAKLTQTYFPGAVIVGEDGKMVNCEEYCVTRLTDGDQKRYFAEYGWQRAYRWTEHLDEAKLYKTLRGADAMCERIGDGAFVEEVCPVVTI